MKSLILAILRKAGTTVNALSSSWHQEKKPLVCKVTRQCVCAPHELLPCTVADDGLLENEMIILTMAMISKVEKRADVFQLWKT